MLKNVFNILTKPYPYYIPYSSSIKLLATFSIMIPAFLIIFQPFGLEDWQCEYSTRLIAGMSLPIFVALIINFYGFSKTWSWFFNEDSWDIGREIVWSIWNILIIVIFIELYWHVVPYCQASMKHFGAGLFQGIMISIFPAAVCISVNYIRAIKARKNHRL